MSKKFNLNLIYLIVAIIIAVCIIYVFQFPRIFVWIKITASNNNSLIEIQRLEQLSEISKEGDVSCLFEAIIFDGYADSVYFEIKPLAENKYYLQGEGYKVQKNSIKSNSMIIETFKLGSKYFPYIKDEKYDYKVFFSKEEGKNNLICSGQITAEIYQRYNKITDLVSLFGLIASLLTILTFLFINRSSKVST